MNAKRIDTLNISLVVISLVIAIKIPFKLFLFSYAILGPLHYLTEISWLHKKNYFLAANKKKWSLLFIILTLIISIYPIVNFLDLEMSQSVDNLIIWIREKNSVLILIGFLFAGCLIFLKRIKSLGLAFFLVTLISFLAALYFPSLFVIIGLFLPTLVHVYVFTLLFILYGALKSKSSYGIFLVIALLIVPFIISFLPIDSITYRPSSDIKDAFISSRFSILSSKIAILFNKLDNGEFNLLSEVGIRIQIFIAFAYTYHYLNWFSKTSIIGWKNAITKKNAGIILVVWVTSISLYIYDFATGFVALFFLSFLHVFLEFPLNVITIREIFFPTKTKEPRKINKSETIEKAYQSK